MSAALSPVFAASSHAAEASALSPAFSAASAVSRQSAASFFSCLAASRVLLLLPRRLAEPFQRRVVVFAVEVEPAEAHHSLNVLGLAFQMFFVIFDGARLVALPLAAVGLIVEQVAPFGTLSPCRSRQ